MTKSHPTLAALALVVLASSCAEPVGVNSNNLGKSGGTSSRGGGTSTTASGGTTETTTATGNGGTTTVTGNGGTAGTTTTTTGSGGTTTTTTTTGSGGATTTTTTTTPSSCGTTTGELLVTNTPKPNDIGATTSIVPAAGVTIPMSEVVVKFCFSLLTTSAVAVAPSAMKIYSGGITVPVDPYYINISTAAVTVDAATGGPTCLVVDVASPGGSAQLTGKSEIKLDWLLQSSALGGAMLDPTKPAQILAIRAATVAGCGDVAM
jgi:hypothetical protein